MSEAAGEELWPAIYNIVGPAPRLADLRAHRLHLLAARAWRRRGRAIPDDLRRDERFAAVRALVTPIVLERALAAYDGRLALMKGAEAGARYPGPALRPYRDLDLLADDAEAAQAALLAAGFEALGDDAGAYDARHHLQPLAWPGTPLLIEIHRRPEWPKWSAPPAAAEVLDAAVPSALGIDGLLAPAPEWHALLLTAHSWSDAPLRRALDLVDVAALGADRSAVATLAERFGMRGVWETMAGAADGLLGRGPAPRAFGVWARDIRDLRDRTVLENHVARVLSPFAVLPPRAAARVSADALTRVLRPIDGECWDAKRARGRRALRHALRPLADHHAT